MRTRRLDVSDLEPPEPMQRALAALRELGADEQLLMVHRREPHPLLAMLPGLGFGHTITRVGDEVHVVIRRAPAGGGR